MYGVGLNPIYMERMEERAAKKKASGQAAQEEFDEAVAEKLDVLFDPNAAPLERSEPAPEAEPVPVLASGDEEEVWVQVECTSWVFAGDELSVNTPDGDRIEVTVPEWVASGDYFWVALCEDGEWIPMQRDEATTVGVVEPVGNAASPAAEELSLPSIREMEMESFDGVVEPAAAAGEPADDVFGALYANPYSDLEDEMPLGLDGSEEPPPI